MDGRQVILIVDDTPENLRVLGDMLEQEYEVRIASRGEDALQNVKASAPDLILLDIMMPGMGGYEICRRLKADPASRMIPVLFISALDLSEHKIHAFREGAADYITKPFQAEEVVARVRTHLQLSKMEDLKREIAERKKAEDALRHQNAILEAQIHSTIDGILIVDGQGRKVLQNRRTVELWKIPPDVAERADDQLQVQHVMRMAKDPESFVAKVAHLYNHPDEICRDEVELTDGTVLDRYTAPVLGKDGQNYGRIWTFRDITERKRAEARERLNLAQLLESDRLASLGTLVAGVAHEINNPNGFILLWTSILDETVKRICANDGTGEESLEELRREAEAACANIKIGSERINLLVDELKEFAKDKSMVLDAAVDVNRVIDSAITLTRDKIKTATDVFRFERGEGLPAIIGHAQKLEQVVINLISNACDALTDRNQALVICSRFDPVSNRVIMQVRDEGMGMTEEVLRRIRDPFFTTKQDGRGTGLGVSISAQIVEKHGGELTFESSPGKGTTAMVALPVQGLPGES